MERSRRPVGGLLEASPGGLQGPEGGQPQGPRHVAIIMDGNGRWAAEREQPRVAGHRAGVESIRHVVRACPDLGIEVLTLYAFSTENWKRPRAEVDALMALLVEYFQRELDQLCDAGVRIRVMGRVHELPPLQRQAVEEAVRRTRAGRRLVLNLALNYGSHAELVDAFRAILDKVRRGEIRAEDVDETVISRHLYTAGLPEPDLIIRTGGEMRLSNFLLWQAAYAELWITPVYWPDFRREHLEQAVRDFVQRERRFGAVPGP